MDTVVPARRIPTVHLLLLLFSLCCFNGVITSAQQLHPDDVSVLRQIDAKLKVGWDFDTLNPCNVNPNIFVTDTTLRNVTCGDCDANNTCRVTAVLLKRQNLTGFLPPDFANLTSLVRLDLTRNYINGTIPREWGSLPRLVQLDLGENRISGSIPPELGNITTLTNITVENNLLQGPIPIAIGDLKNLIKLVLSGNDFTGELPESMGNLKNLQDFRIDGTGISGKIPDFIGNWTSLQKLYMQGTSLEGSFPPSFSSLQNLLMLRVSDLKGVGTFPPLSSMAMTHLVLRNCSLTGALPDIVGKMTGLKVLDLSFNNFMGEIPSSYQSMKYMFLSLNNNSLTGSLPNWNPGASQYIDVSYNFFNESLGPPADCFDGYKNVIASFSSSESSTIKTCLRKNYPCEGNPLNYNLFINCGGPEFKVGDTQYEADNGNAAGPASFRSPSGKWAFSSSGDFFDNDNMAYVATSNSILNTNNTQLYMNARLSPSSLIYYGLCMQTGNYTVNLHFAEIMFIDGQTYYSVGRRFFDVYIQGQKVLEDFNIAEAANGTGRSVIKSFNATVGNGALKIQFQWAGKGTTSVPEKGVYGPLISAISVTPNFTPFIPSGRSRRTISTGAIVGIVLASCLVILLIVLIVWFLIQRRYRRYEGLKGVPLMTSKFTLRQIKSATGNFDRANKIGEGGFGPVFKGVLPNGTLIAVKKLSARSKQGNREFLNEIGLISSLQHPNLVKLYGCCVEEDQLLLVYEYMENNSLATVLFGERKELKLDWRTRHNICLGVARGLAYLHEESRLKIVHRDIKANNVLLDKDFNAKISDFGLAKLDDDENTHMSTRIAGTRGYMAPEYATRGHLTDKADVYSFGIVLLEILSGKSHMIHMPDFTKLHLLDLAHNLEKNGRLHELVDENLGSDYSRDELVQIIKLALACASKSPSNRPTMSTVVSMLETGEFIQTQPVNQGLSDRQEPNDISSIHELPHYSNDLSEDRSSRDPPTTTTGTYSQSSVQLNMDSYLEAIPR